MPFLSIFAKKNAKNENRLSVLSLDLKVGGNNGKVAGQAKILSSRARRLSDSRGKYERRWGSGEIL